MCNGTSSNSDERRFSSAVPVDTRPRKVDDSGHPTLTSRNVGRKRVRMKVEVELVYQGPSEPSTERAEKDKIGCTACRLIEGFLGRVTAVCDCTICKRVNDCLKQQLAGEPKQYQDATTDTSEESPAQNAAKEDSNDTPLPETEIQRLLEIADATPDKQAQERDDYIEGLKRQADEAKDLDARLTNLLERRKEELRALEAERRAQDGRQEFTIKMPKKTRAEKRNE